MIRQLINAHRESLPAINDVTTLRDFLLRVATWSVTLRRELLRLRPELYVRHIEHFEALAPEVLADPELKYEVSIAHFAQQLAQYRAEIRIDDIDRAAFLGLRTLQLVTCSIAVERRAYLDDAQTPQQIANMLYGLLT